MDALKKRWTMIVATGIGSLVAGSAIARNCQYIDNYALPTDVQGEAEILEMYNAFADDPSVVQCEFDVGDLVAAVAVINDWPGGALTQDLTLFYCESEVVRCFTEGIDYGDLEPGDYLLVVTARVPALFHRPVCALDWHTEIFADDRSWDVGGLGELAPGPDLGPETTCDCTLFYKNRKSLSVGQ